MAYVNETDPLWGALSGIIQDEGLRLYDCERLGAGGLRVTIAAANAASPQPQSSERGDDGASEGEVVRENVSSGDCSRVCRRLMVFFEAEGPSYGLTTEPHIEVSSPGVNRTLRLPVHFQEAVGERVKVVASGSAQEKTAGAPLVGTLSAFDGEVLKVTDETTAEPVTVPLRSVKRARVDFKF